jgi:GAF domain-containing protein
VSQKLSSPEHEPSVDLSAEDSLDKPRLDQDTFQQLLGAAFVLQEHNDRLLNKQSAIDSAQSLSEIIATQQQIQTQQLDLQAATALIAERIQKIARASGAAVGILREDHLSYCAATGSAADEARTELPIDACLAAECLRSGGVLQSPEAEKDTRLKPELCRERNVKSLIAVAAHHEGKVAGILELRFDREGAFQEEHVRASQLMAGLVGEAIARAADIEWKEALATERALMLEALERIKPQIERLVVEAPQKADAPIEPSEESLLPSAVPVDSKSAPLPTENQPSVEKLAACHNCGREFRTEELFCGNCGSPRSVEDASGGDLQGKWASMCYQPATGETDKEEGTEGPAFAGQRMTDSDAAMPPALQEIASLLVDEETNRAASGGNAVSVVPTEETLVKAAPVPETTQNSPWTSATKARAWLESVQGSRRFWKRQKANIYLGAAAIVLIAVLSGWGTRSPRTFAANSGAAAANKRPTIAPEPKLTLGEKFLVSIGLAEAPPPTVSMGNPDAQVWVDLHTALYYCSGADLYGKTSTGKFTTQRDAQLDQFEPAYRKNCE